MDTAPNDSAAELNGQHVSGFYALILLSVLRGLLPAQAVQDVLVRAGERARSMNWNLSLPGAPTASSGDCSKRPCGRWTAHVKT